MDVNLIMSLSITVPVLRDFCDMNCSYMLVRSLSEKVENHKIKKMTDSFFCLQMRKQISKM